MSGEAMEPGSRAGRLAMYNNNRFKIGMFGANCSGGRTMTKVPERWSGSWDDCLKLAQLSDDAGLDYILPVATWKGTSLGESDYHGNILETVSWCCGVLQGTKKMTVFATVQVPLFHPILAAKQFVTADQIGHGRFGLNVVSGWNPNDFALFKGMFQDDKDSRYRYAQEWMDAIKRIWSETEEFDVRGEFINIDKAKSGPLPYGGTQPLIVNAGSSPVGQDFAIRNFDVIITSTDKDNLEDHLAHNRAVREKAKAMNRPDIGIFGVGGITCRKTRKEAEEYHYYACYEQADWPIIYDLVDRYTSRFPTPPTKEEREHYARTFALGGYGGLIMVGDPDMIAADLARCAESGMDGIAMHLINYVDEFPLFRDEVLPRLERLGLREPVRS